MKHGKNGTFVACTGYPECSFTSDFERGDDGKIIFKEHKNAESTGIMCEKCGAELVIKRSRFGEMLACSGYPECKNIKNFIRLPDGSIKVLAAGEKLAESCPDCGKGDVVLKSGRNGLFAACSTYPNCKFTANVAADEHGNLTIKPKAAQETMGTCDKCGKPMVVKKSFRGPFLACSGYPDCKNTKSMKGAGSGDAPAKATKAVKTPAKTTTKKATATKKATTTKKAAPKKPTTPKKPKK
jgi:DNA topoisomerase-1